MSSPSEPQPSSESVLLVEDESLVLRILAGHFRKAGYTVATAKNGVEGLAQFNQGKWSIVVTDLSMPDMDGEQMARAIRALKPDVPIILITGFPESVVDTRLFYGVLAKPFQPDQLLDLVAGVLCGS